MITRCAETDVKVDTETTQRLKVEAWRRYIKVRALWYYHASGASRPVYGSVSLEIASRYATERAALETQYTDFEWAYTCAHPVDAHNQHRQRERNA